MSLRTGSPILSVLRREGAQTMAEYALILGFVTIVAVVGLAAVSTQVSSLYDAIVTAWP